MLLLLNIYLFLSIQIGPYEDNQEDAPAVTLETSMVVRRQ